MSTAKKPGGAKKKSPVEKAVKRIVAMMENSAKSLPPVERDALLGKIREIAAATVAESRSEGKKQKAISAAGTSARKRKT